MENFKFINRYNFAYVDCGTRTYNRFTPIYDQLDWITRITRKICLGKFFLYEILRFFVQLSVGKKFLAELACYSLISKKINIKFLSFQNQK